ncbi:hypothetical protein ACJJIF_07290 [Microbulbifer sp. SSSA002]|uniref:hypothetical protein n=1 Tax=Microbulbifer sp. SSSA002 TaxID=3243376 RepID=UPI00403962B1
MSYSIPFDPALTLGNIVPNDHIEVLKEIDGLQREVDKEKEKLNSQIMLKHEIELTKQELVNTGVQVDNLEEKISDIAEEISTTAENYADVALAKYPEIQEARASLPAINSSIESPIDLNKSEIKRTPISSDSMSMNAQYFSYEENFQASSDVMAQISSYISASTSFMGSSRSAEISNSVQTQIQQQIEHHSVAGTLLITANCTHKQSSMYAPFIIDVDKGVRAWNAVFQDNANLLIDTSDPNSIWQIANSDPAEETMNILSGATYGSSFVGMVHVLRDNTTRSAQQMQAAAASLQVQMDAGSWFADVSGGFGVDASFAESVKSVLSSSSISSHVTLVTHGVIPTIQANTVSHVIKGFSDDDMAETMNKLAGLQNRTADKHDSLRESAEAARTGARLIALESAKLESAVTAVKKLDGASNKMLDIDTLMTAFTYYVDQAAAGEAGVPINFFIKPINRRQLAEMWVAKHIPGRYITSDGDDGGVDVIDMSQ